MTKPNKFKITAFRAHENIDRCWEYLKGHRRVLEEHGLTHMLTFNERWLFERNNVIICLSDHFDENILGGLRIQIRKNDYLPFEQTLQRLKLNLDNHNPQLFDMELCGLWHAKSVSGYNLSLIMSQYAYCIAKNIIRGRVFMFNAKYTFHIPRTMNFGVYDKIGVNGHIAYPNEHFMACIWCNPQRDNLIIELPKVDYAISSNEIQRKNIHEIYYTQQSEV